MLFAWMFCLALADDGATGTPLPPNAWTWDGQGPVRQAGRSVPTRVVAASSSDAEVVAALRRPHPMVYVAAAAGAVAMGLSVTSLGLRVANGPCGEGCNPATPSLTQVAWGVRLGSIGLGLGALGLQGRRNRLGRWYTDEDVRERVERFNQAL